MRFDEGLLVGGDVLLDGNGLVAGSRSITPQGRAQLIQVKIQAAGDEGKIGVDVAILFADQEAGDRRIIVDHEAVFAVEELAARGQNRHFANAILLGQDLEILGAKHLQPPKPRGQRQHHQQNAVLDDRQLDRG